MDRRVAHAAAARLDTAGWGAWEWVLLLVAIALTMLLVAVVVDLASRGRARRHDREKKKFTLAQAAQWLRVGAAGAAVLAMLVIIWWAFGRLVG